MLPQNLPLSIFENMKETLLVYVNCNIDINISDRILLLTVLKTKEKLISNNYTKQEFETSNPCVSLKARNLELLFLLLGHHFKDVITLTNL